MIKHLLAVSVLFLCLSGCQSKPPEQVIEPTIEGEWQVSKIANINVESFNQASLRFEQGELTGNNSCNSFFGEYLQQGNTLTLSAAGSTRKACIDRLMKQEQAFMQAIPLVSQFTIDRNKLRLLDSNGTVLFELTKAE